MANKIKEIIGLTQFGIDINGDLINVYSKDNPILNINQTAYFIFNSLDNAHIPLIGYGTIINDKYNKGMDKTYYVKLLKIHSKPELIKNFFYDNLFKIYGYGTSVHKTNQLRNKIVKMNPHLLSKQPIFAIPSFFIRPTNETIQKLLIDYKNVILTDLRKQLKETESI